MGMPWFRQSDMCISPRRVRFDPRPVHIGFVVESDIGADSSLITSLFHYQHHFSIALYLDFINLPAMLYLRAWHR